MTDPTSRALTLLGLLERRPTWSGADLAARLDVTERTLRRDIDRLRELGYTIDSAPGAAGGYALGRGRLLPPLLLDAAQAVAVTTALITAAQDGHDERAEDAVHALSTIDAIMPNAVREQLAPLREAAAPAQPGGAARVDVGLLLACAEAVRGHRRLRFDYTDRNGACTHRDVEPHRLLMRGGGWRIVAHCRDRDAWRTFRLDRMQDVSVSTFAFTPRPDAEQAVDAASGLMPIDAWRHGLHLRVTAPPERVAAHPAAGHARLSAREDGGTDVVMGSDDPRAAARWLACLPFGELEVSVLGDEEVCQAVRDLAARLQGMAGGRPVVRHA